MTFKKWVKSIQNAGYNGLHTVFKNSYLKEYLVSQLVISPKLAIYQQKHEFDKTREAYKTLKIGSDQIRLDQIQYELGIKICLLSQILFFIQHFGLFDSIFGSLAFCLYENINKLPSKVADLNSIADRPKTSPNLKSCFIRIVTS